MMPELKSLDRFGTVAYFIADAPSLLLLEQASQVATHRRIVVCQ